MRGSGSDNRQAAPEPRADSAQRMRFSPLKKGPLPDPHRHEKFTVATVEAALRKNKGMVARASLHAPDCAKLSEAPPNTRTGRRRGARVDRGYGGTEAPRGGATGRSLGHLLLLEMFGEGSRLCGAPGADGGGRATATVRAGQQRRRDQRRQGRIHCQIARPARRGAERANRRATHAAARRWARAQRKCPQLSATVLYFPRQC